MATTAQISVRSRGLECRVGAQRLSIPLLHVDQLIEYRRSPLPLARAGVAGLGVHQGELIVSLSLPSLQPRPRRSGELTKGVLLRAFSGRLRCAIEVDETLAFIDLTLTDRASDPSSWVRSALTASGAPMLELDVTALLQSLQIEVPG